MFLEIEDEYLRTDPQPRYEIWCGHHSHRTSWTTWPNGSGQGWTWWPVHHDLKEEAEDSHPRLSACAS